MARGAKGGSVYGSLLCPSLDMSGTTWSLRGSREPLTFFYLSLPGMLLSRGGSHTGTGSTAAARPYNHRKLRPGAFVWSTAARQ